MKRIILAITLFSVAFLFGSGKSSNKFMPETTFADVPIDGVGDGCSDGGDGGDGY